MENVEILGEEVLFRSGCFRRVRRWLRGIHPGLGVVIRGYTGWETVQEISVIRPMTVLYVSEANFSPLKNVA